MKINPSQIMSTKNTKPWKDGASVVYFQGSRESPFECMSRGNDHACFIQLDNEVVLDYLAGWLTDWRTHTWLLPSTAARRRSRRRRFPRTLTCQTTQKWWHTDALWSLADSIASTKKNLIFIPRCLPCYCCIHVYVYFFTSISDLPFHNLRAST